VIRCPACNYELGTAPKHSQFINCPECGVQVNTYAMQIAQREATPPSAGISREVAILIGTVAAISPVAYSATPLVAYALAPRAGDGTIVPLAQSGTRIASLRSLIDFVTCCGLPILLPLATCLMVFSLARAGDRVAMPMAATWTLLIALGVAMYASRWWIQPVADAWAWFLQ
jgi:hypothetical protein